MPAAAAHQVDESEPIRKNRVRPQPARTDDLDDPEDLDWSDVTDAEGEAYTSFAYEDDWPGPFGAASVGAP